MANRKAVPRATKQVAYPSRGAKVLASAQDIWMAGLGTFAKAQDDGNRLLESLAARGRNFRHRMSSKSGSALLSERMASLGELLEDSTSSVLNRTGVATRQEVVSLSRRVSKLAKEVEKLTAGSKPSANSRPISPVRKASAPRA